MLAQSSGFFDRYLAILISGAIVLVGLLGIGFRDVRRFSLRRTAAIASVCFRQSIRRRVLWITPLIILGIIVITQFQRPDNAQEAVRQITAYCLFATGMLLALVLIVLACTNLPREIESRVIYTIATKPTTRLEIVVGKVAGFAGVSACTLLIMGAFTLGFLHWQDWQTRSKLREVLAADTAEGATILPTTRAGEKIDPARATMAYYVSEGTLHARKAGLPASLAFYSHLPSGPQDEWYAGGAEGEIRARFSITPSVFAEIPVAPRFRPAGPKGPGLIPLCVDVTVEARPLRGAPTAAPAPTTQSTTRATTRPAGPPAQLTIELLDAQKELVVPWGQLWGYDQQRQPKPGEPVREIKIRAVDRAKLAWWGGVREFEIPLESEFLERWFTNAEQENVLYVSIGGTEGYEYHIRNIELVAGKYTERPRRWQHEGIEYTGRGGAYGQQLKGSQERSQWVAVYGFRGLDVPGGGRNLMLELRGLIEGDRSGDDVEFNHVTVQVDNPKAGIRSEEFSLYPESNRPSYVSLPAAAVAGGNFDVIVRLKTGGWLTLKADKSPSLRIMLADQPFAWNLLKSLSILWLMSLLITIVAIFTSTFLSWPIAVMLTLVILSGRWGTEQLGDMLRPGIGRQIVTDLFRGASPESARAVSQTVDVLAEALRAVSSVLPDISQYAAIESIQAGVAISAGTLLASLKVTLVFGLPMLVLGYVFLRFKEVAP